MKLKISAAFALAATLAGSPVLAQTRPAQPAQTRPAQPAQAAPQQQQQVAITSVPLLCRVREQELVGINRLVADRNQALQREADPTKRQALGQQLQNFVNNLRETEASWSRMDCARILYGAR